MKFQVEVTHTAPDIIVASKDGEQYLLVSDSFYDYEDHLAFPAIQLEFYRRFATWVDELSRELGPALVQSIGWGEFPDDSSAIVIATWQKCDVTFRLELQHEDRECPLMIVFRRSDI